MGFWADMGVSGQEKWDLTTGVTLVWIYLKSLPKEVAEEARPIPWPLKSQRLGGRE